MTLQNTENILMSKHVKSQPPCECGQTYVQVAANTTPINLDLVKCELSTSSRAELNNFLVNFMY